MREEDYRVDDTYREYIDEMDQTSPARGRWVDSCYDATGLGIIYHQEKHWHRFKGGRLEDCSLKK